MTPLRRDLETATWVPGHDLAAGFQSSSPQRRLSRRRPKYSGPYNPQSKDLGELQTPGSGWSYEMKDLCPHNFVFQINKPINL